MPSWKATLFVLYCLLSLAIVGASFSRFWRARTDLIALPGSAPDSSLPRFTPPDRPDSRPS